MKVVKRIISVILAIIVFLSIIAMTCLEVVNQVVSSPENMANKIIDDKYVDYLNKEIYGDLDKSLSLVIIKSKDFEDIITKDFLRTEGLDALTTTLSCMFGLCEESYSFESKAIKERIEERLELYAQEFDIEYVDGSSDEVYELITDRIELRLSVVSDSYTELVAPYAQKAGMLSSYWYLPLVLAIFCFAIMIVLELKRIRTALYTAVLPCFLGSFTTLAFSVIMLNKNYLAKIVLSDGAFKYMIQKFYSAVFSTMKDISLMLSILFLVSAIVIIALIFILPDRKDRRHLPREA